MQIVFAVLVLLLAVALSGVASRLSPFKLPLPLFQIALGAVLAFPMFGLHVQFNPEVFLLLFIPPLLFADGWRIPKRALFRLRRPILALALGLVLFTVVGVGYFIHWLIPTISLPVAFALAAVLSPTDAVAVSSVVGKRGLPRNLRHMIEGEALMNDASGLVTFKFAIAAALTGTFSIWQAGLSFMLIASGGLAVGTMTAWLLSYARRQVRRWAGEDPAIQVVLLLLTPFAAYLFAEQFQFSGILAAVAAGIAMTYTESANPGSSSTRLQTNSVWAMLEFVFNGMTFILLGLQLPSVVELVHQDAIAAGGVTVWHLCAYVAAIIAVLLALRFVWVLVMQHLASFRHALSGPMRRRVNGWVVLAATFSGVRGAVTMAGVMAVPLTQSDGLAFPGRDLLVFLATGVILGSLLCASVVLPWLASKLPRPAESLQEQEEARARLLLAQAAIDGLEETRLKLAAGMNDEEQAVLAEVNADIQAVYRRRVDADSDSGDIHRRAVRYRLLEFDLRMAALDAERREIYRLRENYQVDDEVFRELLRNIDLAENWLSGRLVSPRK